VHKNTLLVPTLLIWLVLALTVRRDLNYHQVLNWLVSGYRWLDNLLPPKAKLVKDGTISKARVRLGVDVFRLLFKKFSRIRSTAISKFIRAVEYPKGAAKPLQHTPDT
jgi:hypothetical protein